MIGLNHRGEALIKIKKSQVTVYFLALLLFLPNNIGSFPVLGSVIVVLNNVAALFALLQLLYYALHQRRLNVHFSPVCVLGVIFFGIRIALTYIHGGTFTLANYVTVVKWIAGIMWLDHSMRDRSERYNPILYSFLTWTVLDCLITIVSPNGSELFGGGYPLGWKNNKVEFLFLSNLMALIKIQKEGLTYKDKFFRVWVIIAVLSIANPLLVDSGTTSLIIIMLVAFPLLKKVTEKGSFLCGPLILGVHAVIWFLVVVNNQTESSIIGAINEALFHRDATFTGRIYLWKTAMLLISQSFWTGYMKDIEGYGQWTVITSDLKGYEWEMAHNQVLELFMQGGIILFACFAVIILWCLWENRVKNGDTLLGRWALFVLLFSYLTEAFSGEITFIILIMIYQSARIVQHGGGSQKEKEYGNIKILRS